MQTTDAKKVHELAEQLSAAFVRDTRNDGNEFVKLRDGSPQWMTDVIHAAHGDKMPDDWVYAFCEKAADAIAEADADGDTDDFSDAIGELEVYCDQAIEEGLWESGGANDGRRQHGLRDHGQVTGLVAVGMYLHMREVGEALLAALIEHAGTLEAEG